jgi:hypothetical protein
VTTLTVFRILFQSMVDVILRSMIDLLLMQPHRAVAMHASDTSRRNADDLGRRHLNPFPIVVARASEFLFLFASCHQVMWHCRVLLLSIIRSSPPSRGLLVEASCGKSEGHTLSINTRAASALMRVA